VTETHSTDLQCSNCGNRQPQGLIPFSCSVCGSTSFSRLTGLTLSDTIESIHDRACGTSANVNTKRPATIFDTLDGVPYPEVRALVDQVLSCGPCSQDLRVFPAYVKITKELKAVTKIGLSGIFYRARGFDTPPVEWSHRCFYRPPAEKTKIGRYNPAGDSVLYLARCSRTARGEIVRGNPPAHISVAQFRVNAPQARWLEFRRDMESTAPYLNTFLFISEKLPEESSKTEAYFPSHLLRAIVEEHGLSAIEYPSVRVPTTETEDSKSRLRISFLQTVK